MAVTIQVGSRTITISASPLATPAAHLLNRALKQPRPDLLVIRPALHRVHWIITTVSGVGLLLGSFWSHLADFRLACLIFRVDFRLACLIFLGMVWVHGAITLSGRRSFFDRGTGMMTYGRFFIWEKRALAQIIGVQLTHGGKHQWLDGTIWRISVSDGEVQRRYDPSMQYQPIYQTYQVNVIIDDGDCPRLNVSNHSDLNWTRRAGRRLAEFLQVPLVDQAPAGKHVTG